MLHNVSNSISRRPALVFPGPGEIPDAKAAFNKGTDLSLNSTFKGTSS
jgi:hypothetical protein